MYAWRVHSGDNVNAIASANDIIDQSKYNVSIKLLDYVSCTKYYILIFYPIQINKYI